MVMVRSKNYMSVQRKISPGLVAVIVSTSSFDGRRIIKEHLNSILSMRPPEFNIADLDT